MAEPPVTLIQRQQWLEPFESGAQNAVKQVFQGSEPGRRLKDALQGKWFGHPLHPAVTDIPMGAWTTALVLDLMDANGRRDCRAGADVAVAVGLTGAGVAALAGIADWHEMEGEGRRVGFTHGVLNLMSAGLYAASLVARRDRNRPAGRALALAGFTVAAISAYLGGSLVFGEASGKSK